MPTLYSTIVIVSNIPIALIKIGLQCSYLFLHLQPHYSVHSKYLFAMYPSQTDLSSFKCYTEKVLNFLK